MDGLSGDSIRTVADTVAIFPNFVEGNDLEVPALRGPSSSTLLERASNDLKKLADGPVSRILCGVRFVKTNGALRRSFL